MGTEDKGGDLPCSLRQTAATQQPPTNAQVLVVVGIGGRKQQQQERKRNQDTKDAFDSQTSVGEEEAATTATATSPLTLHGEDDDDDDEDEGFISSVTSPTATISPESLLSLSSPHRLAPPLSSFPAITIPSERRDNDRKNPAGNYSRRAAKATDLSSSTTTTTNTNTETNAMAPNTAVVVDREKQHLKHGGGGGDDEQHRVLPAARQVPQPPPPPPPPPPASPSKCPAVSSPSFARKALTASETATLLESPAGSCSSSNHGRYLLSPRSPRSPSLVPGPEDEEIEDNPLMMDDDMNNDEGENQRQLAFDDSILMPVGSDLTDHSDEELKSGDDFHPVPGALPPAAAVALSSPLSWSSRKKLVKTTPEEQERLLCHLEQKVRLEELLHHRRLPSTIYEDPSSSQRFEPSNRHGAGGVDEDEDDDDSFFHTSPAVSTDERDHRHEQHNGTTTTRPGNEIATSPNNHQQNKLHGKSDEEKNDDSMHRSHDPSISSSSSAQAFNHAMTRAAEGVTTTATTTKTAECGDKDGRNRDNSNSNNNSNNSLAGAVKKILSLENLQKLIQQNLPCSSSSSQQQQQTSEASTTTQSKEQHPTPASTTSGQPPPVITMPLATWKQRRDEKERRQREYQYFAPMFVSSRLFQTVSKYTLRRHYSPVAAATWVGFWALLHVSCSNHVLTPLRDAIALQVGVRHMPTLTLVSTVLAFGSSVPIGWLFEAPDPGRRKLWKRMGLTRGETQGSSLALFYRFFALTLVSYSIGFALVNSQQEGESSIGHSFAETPPAEERVLGEEEEVVTTIQGVLRWFGQRVGMSVYIAFFLVVHLMKLHSTSLVWGVTTEAMEYEEVARRKNNGTQMDSNKTRLQRLALIGFGGTLGGILGSVIASSMAHYVRLPGLLLMAAFLLEIAAELSIELGRIMQKHWEEQQLFQSTNDLASLDSSMKRSTSLGSMKRVASGNSLNRVRSATDLGKSGTNGGNSNPNAPPSKEEATAVDDNTFTQRLLRGITTIIRSRLLMAIFTYNALYASTNVLLSFQRAELVANRDKNGTTAEADTAFLARINMASSVSIFALQATGMGAFVAHTCGSRGTLTLMPLARLLGVLSLVWWHRTSNGTPPNLIIFLIVDEFCKVMNLAVAKPVRESLWRGLSNEARYEAKPIVDTLANRWGGGSAAFLVSFLHRVLDMFGVEAGSDRKMFGLPPILFLCTVIAAWWTAVSADLGHIRKNIDLELKKRQ